MVYIYCNRNEIVIRVTIRMYENRYIACHGNIDQSYKHAPGFRVLRKYIFFIMNFCEICNFLIFDDYTGTTSIIFF
jgi:hypothetical protein